MSTNNPYVNPKTYPEVKKQDKDSRDEEAKKMEALVPTQNRKRSSDDEYVATHLRLSDTKYIPKLLNPILSNEKFHEFGGSQLSGLKEDGTSLPTCHLCGKAVCGQRMGRIQCSTCSKIFCLQQLQRKFDMVVDINDTSFRCPRCLGFCCCVCDCRRPPPHVHCKVFKVRENKRKRLENMEANAHPPSVPPPPLKQEIPATYYTTTPMSSIPLNPSMKSLAPLSPLTTTPIGLIPRNSSITSMTTLDLSMQPLKGEDPIQSRLYQNPNDNYPIIVPSDPWNQSCNIWQNGPHPNNSQNQGIDWLAALNDSLLVPSSPLPGYNNNSNGMSSSLSNQNNSSSRNSLYGNNSQNNNSSTNLSSNSSTGANFSMLWDGSVMN